MSDWLEEEHEGRMRLGVRVERRLLKTQSKYQTIEIVESQPYGKLLALDGTFQTSVGDEHYYHEMLVHPALTTARSIKRVLIVGGGDGGTAREVLRHPEVESVKGRIEVRFRDDRVRGVVPVSNVGQPHQSAVGRFHPREHPNIVIPVPVERRVAHQYEDGHEHRAN